MTQREETAHTYGRHGRRVRTTTAYAECISRSKPLKGREIPWKYPHRQRGFIQVITDGNWRPQKYHDSFWEPDDD